MFVIAIVWISQMICKPINVWMFLPNVIHLVGGWLNSEFKESIYVKSLHIQNQHDFWGVPTWKLVGTAWVIKCHQSNKLLHSNPILKCPVLHTWYVRKYSLREKLCRCEKLKDCTLERVRRNTWLSTCSLDHRKEDLPAFNTNPYPWVGWNTSNSLKWDHVS